MKLKDLMEEMGQRGMLHIRNKVQLMADKLGLSGNWDIRQGSGTTITITKSGKPFASVPVSKAMNDEFIKTVLSRGMGSGK